VPLIRPAGRVLDLAAGNGCEQGEIALPHPAVIQRVAAVNGPSGRLL